jgi:hypothetical protein
MVNDGLQTIEAIRTHGWRVVLLGNRSKRVHTRHWDVTTDVDRVSRHLRAGGNVGLLCSESNGVAVLDPDQLLPWAEMIDALGQPAAAWVETGSGKLHYYVKWEPDLPAKLEWERGIIGEVQRGPGLQQIVIPPSLHPSGRRYRWIVDPVHQPLESLPGEWRAYCRGLVYGRGH